jgi:hypothetical protein
MADESAVVGSGIEIFRGAPIAFHGPQFRIPGVHHGAPERQKLRQDLLHGLDIVGFHLETQMGRVAIRASDVKLFDLETPMELDNGIENLFHDVRVDEMTVCFHHFLERKRVAALNHFAPL